jgi:type IX secretion system PorP/SprF family membrane protein
MKKVLLILLFCIVYAVGSAQSHIRLNNYWENLYTINPASINNSYAYAICLAARKQWINFPGAPTSLFASATTFIDNANTQMGIKVIEDRIAYTHMSYINMSYAYGIRVNDDWRINLGLAGSYQNLSYDLSQSNLEEGNDPAFYEKLLRVNNYNSDLGLEITNKLFRFGATTQNIFSSLSSGSRNQVNTNIAYLLYRKTSEQFTDWGFGVSAIQYRKMFQMEFNATSFIKSHWQKDLLQIGGFYRTNSEIGMILGIDLSDMIHVSYSYDYNLSSIRLSSIGTHELMITYKLKRCPTCH